MAAEIRDWDETKRRLQRRWPGLTAEEIDESHGDRDALLALLEGRLGYARANAEGDLDEILSGESVVPEDVADEATHTGTSGPVGPISDATDFTRGSNQEVPDVTSNQWTSNSEPGELPNQPPEVSSIPGGGSPFGATGMGTSGSGAGGGENAPRVDGGRWGQDPFDPTREMGGHDGGGMRMAMPKAAAGAAAVGVGALAVGMMIRRRKKHSKRDDVTDQARRLLSDISDKMPTVEEVRAKVLAIDELRNRKELKGKKLAALARK